jgi:hypothetical protein
MRIWTGVLIFICAATILLGQDPELVKLGSKIDYEFH